MLKMANRPRTIPAARPRVDVQVGQVVDVGEDALPVGVVGARAPAAGKGWDDEEKDATASVGNSTLAV